MKKYRIAAVIMTALLIVFVAAGCGGNAGEDLAMDLGENLAEDLTGSEISTDNKWPEEMPDKVPEMKKGRILNSTAITVGGKINVTISFENVSEKDFEDYSADVESAGFNVVISSQSGGIDSKTYSMGENALSVQYASKSKELIITYTGE